MRTITRGSTTWIFDHTVRYSSHELADQSVAETKKLGKYAEKHTLDTGDCIVKYYHKES